MYYDKEIEHGFVYIWVNKKNGRYYIGSHKGTPDDGYLGSGTSFKNAIKKYSIEGFDRYIVFEGTEFRDIETCLIRDYDAVNDRNSYNQKHVHVGGAIHSEASKERQRQKMLGREITWKDKMSAARLGKPLSEKQYEAICKANRSPEQRAKVSAALKGRKITWADKIAASKTGQKRSEESRRKQSETLTGKKRKPLSEETKAKIAASMRAFNANKYNKSDSETKAV